MLIKNTNLYINEKNIVTLQPYSSAGSYGLIINGSAYEFGHHLKSDKALVSASLGKMKALQTQIIKAINK